MIPIFFGVALVISLLPVVLLARLPEAAVLPVSFIVRVVLPVLLASLVFGFASVTFTSTSERDGAPSDLAEPVDVVLSQAKDLAAAGLLGGMVALTMVVFFGGLGLFLLPLFFGPPILVQAIALERLSVQEAWVRTRTLMAGNWGRAMVLLLAAVLMVGSIGVAALSGSFSLTAGMGRFARAAIFTVLQAAIAGTTLPFLAAAGHSVFVRLAADEPRP